MRKVIRMANSTENYRKWANKNAEHVAEYKARYNREHKDEIMATMKEHTVVKPIRLNYEKDADILTHIEGKNFCAYVKSLIRKDMTAK